MAELARTNFPQLSDREKRRLQKEGQCFTCQKQGHMSRECPKGKKPAEARRPPPRKESKARITEADSSEEEDESNLEIKSQASLASKATQKNSLLSHVN